MKKTIFLISLFLVSFYCFGQRSDTEQVRISETEYSRLDPASKKAAEKKTAFDKLSDMARLGDPQATYGLGISYLTGKHGKRDHKKAFVLISKAADMGVARAWVDKGSFYKYGLGVEMDYAQAYQYYCKAAALNDPSGLYQKGYMQYKGFGCEQDYADAVEAVKKGAALNSLGSMYMLGLCYRNGFGVEKDADTAYYWLKKSADAGYYLASVELRSETPEYNPAAAGLVQKVEAAKRISGKIDYPINEFTKIEGRVSTDEINGLFSGYLLKYDWNGSVIIDATPVSLDLQLADNIISGTWSEESREDILIINGILEDEKIVFKDMDFQMADHFHQDNPLTYRFQTADLELLKKGDDIYIAGNIEIYVPALMEPQKPHSLILSRNSPGNASEQEKKITALTAYPNPFDAQLNIEFSLAAAGKAGLKVTSLDGQLHYRIPATHLEKGDYIIPVLLDVPSGVYMVTIRTGNESRTFKVVKP